MDVVTSVLNRTATRDGGDSQDCFGQSVSVAGLYVPVAVEGEHVEGTLAALLFQDGGITPFRRWTEVSTEA